jgi:hypothetical protein
VRLFNPHGLFSSEMRAMTEPAKRFLWRPSIDLILIAISVIIIGIGLWVMDPV